MSGIARLGEFDVVIAENGSNDYANANFSGYLGYMGTIAQEYGGTAGRKVGLVFQVTDGVITGVFDPYFTTKHQSQGTGIGLYMSQEMVSKKMNGIIVVHNTTYEYNHTEYTGANFQIKLPIH